MDNLSQLLFWSFIGIGSIHLLYIFYFYTGLPFYKETEKSVDFRPSPVSVIVAARNEEERLKVLIPLLMQQDHPDFEVIVINDCSVDESEWVLKDLKAVYTNLHSINIVEQDRWPTGKKFALTLGIKAAKNNILLFTDADCVPHSNSWISNMQFRFTKSAEIVLGYGAYEKKAGILNYLIGYDTLFTALNYLGFAIRHKAYMGVGRNLAYRKQLFFFHKGFSNHIAHPSGDDDLFINQAATSKNVNVALVPEAFTVSEAPSTFGQWFRQKRRHFSTGKFYKSEPKFWLAFGPISYMLTLLALPFALWFHTPLSYEWIGLLSGFGFMYLLRWLFFGLAAAKLQESRLIIWLPFLELIYMVLHPILLLRGLTQKNYYWR